MRRAFELVLLLAAALAAAQPAAALEFTCIEASRYRHLYQLFGGEPKQLAAFLELDPGRPLPRPEHCRAMLVSGKVDNRAEDMERLLAAIEANQGWLAVLQLSSGGGVVQTGYRVGFITRLFWLKTQTAAGADRSLVYTPDFFVPPAAFASDGAGDQPDAARIENWRKYLAAQKGLAPMPLKFAHCVSACSMIHTAGVDRAGMVRVHRARAGGASKGEFINLKVPMSETERRLLRLELEQIEFYRRMDPGPDFVRRYQETPAQTTAPVDVARFPRYVADYLAGRCKVNGDQLQELDRQIANTIGELAAPHFGLWIRTDNLRRALRQLRHLRAEAERCVAAAHERERLSQFAKLCPNGCDRRKLVGLVEDSVRSLLPKPQ
ncbi:MAG: hypothetical protein IT536_16405 [Hyphomicrobiales bacterium]|nr:hypothetical protein [Hyphomicrobiales bacterium]